jgi:hypothetical protein
VVEHEHSSLTMLRYSLFVIVCLFPGNMRFLIELIAHAQVRGFFFLVFFFGFFFTVRFKSNMFKIYFYVSSKTMSYK